jgi:hemin uptake protein HemP
MIRIKILDMNLHSPTHSGTPTSDQAPRDVLVSPSTPAVTERLSSTTLLRGRREIEIDHEGAVYRLRVTALGKLILTK